MHNQEFIPQIPASQQRRYKDQLSRYAHYLRWLDATGQVWFIPDLTAFLDYVIGLRTFQSNTIKALIATIRSRYKQILNDSVMLEKLRIALYGNNYDFNQCIELMKIAADPRNTKFSVKANTRAYRYLTISQANQFLNVPDTYSLRGLRDRAIICSLMFMDLRETELRLLTVEDLHLTSDGAGELGIHVPQGAASIERFVPIYKGFPVKHCLETWLNKAGIKEGPVFRGFFRNERKMRDTPITIQAIEDIFRLYPIEDGEEYLEIKPIDLRIFYARMLFTMDFSIDVIAANLGVQTQTAANYIGTPMKSDKFIAAFELSQL